MKLKVLQPFHDKYTDELYESGCVIEVTEERAEEILSVPFIVEKVDVEEVAPKKATKKKTTKKKE